MKLSKNLKAEIKKRKASIKREEERKKAIDAAKATYETFPEEILCPYCEGSDIQFKGISSYNRKIVMGCFPCGKNFSIGTNPTNKNKIEPKEHKQIHGYSVPVFETDDDTSPRAYFIKHPTNGHWILNLPSLRANIAFLPNRYEVEGIDGTVHIRFVKDGAFWIQDLINKNNQYFMLDVYGKSFRRTQKINEIEPLDVYFLKSLFDAAENMNI